MYTDEVVKITTKGKENIREKMRFCDRISTHTARRTFITLMKRACKPVILIASFTGQSDMITMNQYYQVDNEDKGDAVDEVFDILIPMKKLA